MNTILKSIAVLIAVLTVVRTVVILVTSAGTQQDYLLGVIVGNAALLVLAVLLYRYALKRSIKK